MPIARLSALQPHTRRKRALPLACAVIGHNVEAAATEVAEKWCCRRARRGLGDAQRVCVRSLCAGGSGGDKLNRSTRGDRPPRAGCIGVRPAASSTPQRSVYLRCYGAPRRGRRCRRCSLRVRPALHVPCIVSRRRARAYSRWRQLSRRRLSVSPYLPQSGANLQSQTLPRAVQVVEPAGVVTGPRLEDARIVISGGRGLGAKENYDLVRRLADALGGMPGASRAIVDDGWAEPAQQVGLTGKIVAPDVYFAVGISGASQHLVGCANSRCIVAVNTDPQASIFKFAQYGIVDDGLEVLSALIEFSESN